MTIVDIARAAPVSRSTVSLVLQGGVKVRPATRERVQASMDRLGYVYHRGAANLRRNASEIVGMVINDLTNPLFAEKRGGIEEALQAAGLVPFLAHSGESPVRQAEVMRSMGEHEALGYILHPAIGTDRDFPAELKGWRLPVVTVTRRLPVAWVSQLAPGRGMARPRTRRGRSTWRTPSCRMALRRFASDGVTN